MICQQGPEILSNLYFVKNFHNDLHGGQSVYITKNLQSVFKKHQLGEILVMIGQQGPEILNSLVLSQISTMTSMEVKVPKSLKICKVSLKTP